jgi:hypothetical protein
MQLGCYLLEYKHLYSIWAVIDDQPWPVSALSLESNAIIYAKLIPYFFGDHITVLLKNKPVHNNGSGGRASRRAHPLSSQRSAPFPAACNTWDKRQWGPPDQSKTSFGKGVLIGVDKKMSSSNKIEIFSGQQDQISFLSS